MSFYPFFIHYLYFIFLTRSIYFSLSLLSSLSLYLCCKSPAATVADILPFNSPTLLSHKFFFCIGIEKVSVMSSWEERERENDKWKPQDKGRDTEPKERKREKDDEKGPRNVWHKVDKMKYGNIFQYLLKLNRRLKLPSKPSRVKDSRVLDWKIGLSKSKDSNGYHKIRQVDCLPYKPIDL